MFIRKRYLLAGYNIKVLDNNRGLVVEQKVPWRENPNIVFRRCVTRAIAMRWLRKILEVKKGKTFEAKAVQKISTKRVFVYQEDVESLLHEAEDMVGEIGFQLSKDFKRGLYDKKPLVSKKSKKEKALDKDKEKGKDKKK